MRPPALFPLFAPVASLKGVGPRVAPLLERVAGPLVRDLLFVAPHALIRRRAAKAASAIEGEVQTLRLTIVSHERPHRPNAPWKIRAGDDTGFITLTFFKGHGPHLERTHPPGAVRAVSGKVELDRYSGVLQIAHPDYMLAPERAGDIPEVEAIYPATVGLPSRTVRRFVGEAMARAPRLAEWGDPAFIRRQSWPGWREALMALHAPTSEADLSLQAPHRRRLAFDELLAHQLALAQRKRSVRAEAAPAVGASERALNAEAALPFRLTGAQVRNLAEIRADLASGARMTRLIQGDVGAGKTVVAMLAMVDVAAAGLQSVLMAPTEILARQHFDTLAGPLASQGVLALLLTGRDKGAARAAKLAQLADGRAAVAVGTHALFQDHAAFHRLAFRVIAEQHRFGVSERARLQAKGVGVHLLVMSATPIPRTLELTVFGDLDISRLDEKPPGRRPVATRAAPMSRLGAVIARLKAAIEAGAPAVWVCPPGSETGTAGLAPAPARAGG